MFHPSDEDNDLAAGSLNRLYHSPVTPIPAHVDELPYLKLHYSPKGDYAGGGKPARIGVIIEPLDFEKGDLVRRTVLALYIDDYAL